MQKYKSLLGFLILVFLIAAISSAVTMPEVKNASSWYHGLRQASWQPPAYVFGPAWTILYIMIAVSSWKVWQKLPAKQKFRHQTMRYYWLQLFLNFLWSILFFGLHLPQSALADIILLLVTVALNIFAFKKIDWLAAILLVPYFLWLCFAASLNAAVVVLN